MPNKKNKKEGKKTLVIKPLGDKVLVRAEKDLDQNKTKSGIIIPETINRERSEEGIVIAVGDGQRLDNGQILPLRVKKGDHIIFSKYGPDEIKIDDEDYLIISESNILAIID